MYTFGGLVSKTEILIDTCHLGLVPKNSAPASRSKPNTTHLTIWTIGLEHV